MSKKNWRRDRRTKELERQFHAEYVTTELPDISLLDLMDITIADYNDTHPENDPVDYYTDIDTLYRFAVNYARHWLPGYDASFDRPVQSLSHEKRKDIAFKAASAQIAMKWPELAEACQRQVDMR